MSTWGTGVFEDDTAEDARLEFQDLLAGGVSARDAANRVLSENAEALEDSDDGPVLLLALAVLLLNEGVSSHTVYPRARAAIERGEGLERWREAGPDLCRQRQRVYAEVLARLNDVDKPGAG